MFDFKEKKLEKDCLIAYFLTNKGVGVGKVRWKFEVFCGLQAKENRHEGGLIIRRQFY